MKKLIASLSVFIFSMCCYSQTPLPRIEKIGENKGLVLENEVSDVKVDSEGYIWVITFSEIVRYDGKKFVKIVTSSVDHGSLLKFYEAPNGKKYVTGLDGGFYYILGDSLVAYEYNHILKEKNTYVTAIEVLIDSLDQIHATYDASGMLILKDGIPSNSESYKKLKKEGRNVVFRENLPPAFYKCYTPTTRIEEPKLYITDKASNLVDSVRIVIREKGYYRSIVQLPNKNYLMYVQSENLLEVSEEGIINEFPFGYDVLNIFIDSKEGLWISTAGYGVFYYKDCVIEEGSAEVFFPNTKMIVSAEDIEGGIWVYSEEEGVFRIDHPAVKYYNKNNFPVEQKVEILKLVNRTLCFGNQENNIGKIDLKSNKMENIRVPFSDKQVNNNHLYPIGDIEYDSFLDRLWISQRDNIRYYDGRSWTEINIEELEFPFLQNKVLTTKNLNEGQTLAGTHRKQFFICNDTGITYISKEFPDFLNDLMFKGDTVYVSARDGLYLYLNDSIISYNDKYHELNGKLKDWCLWNNSLWISTKKSGVFILRNDSLEPVKYNGQKLENARIVEQNDNAIWMLSDQGTFEISKKGNGLLINGYRTFPHVFLTDIEVDGETIYAGTKKNGILKVSFEEIKKDLIVAPILNIEKIEIGDDYINSLNTKVESNYKDNTLQVWFVGVSYETEAVNYRYRLKGLNDDWKYTKENYIQYSNLAPGEYSLELQARKSNQLWSNSKSLQFSISSPFWKTWWFIWLSIIVILFIVYYTLSYRIEVANKEKSLTISRLIAEQKALQAKMDPHFMFNVLASLQYLVVNKMTDRATKFLEQFSSLMRSTLDQTNLEFISISGEVSFLKEYVEMEQLRLEDKFDYKFYVDPLLNEEAEIPNFLIQPFIENAIHHGLKNKAGKGNLKCDFFKENEFLKVIIVDDGIGYNKAMLLKSKSKLKRKSHGMTTVKERLELFNEKSRGMSLKIEDINESNPNKTGTKITVLIRIGGKSLKTNA